VDLGNGHHFTHSTHCSLNFTQNSYASSPINTKNPRANDTLYASNSGHNFAIPAQNFNSHPAGHAMTRIRHRMRSRRRNSQGYSTRPTTQPTPDSEAPVSFPSSGKFRGHLSDNYLHTRSGRGQAQIHGARRVNAATQTTGPPDFPHPFYHTTQFRFQSMMNQPAIHATIIVPFSEELNQRETQISRTQEPEPETGMPSRHEKAEKLGDIGAGANTEKKIVSFRRKERYSSTLHGEDMAIGKHVGDEHRGDTQKARGSQGGMSAAMAKEEDSTVASWKN